MNKQIDEGSKGSKRVRAKWDFANWGVEIWEFQCFETDLNRQRNLTGNRERISEKIRSCGIMGLWCS